MRAGAGVRKGSSKRRLHLTLLGVGALTGAAVLGWSGRTTSEPRAGAQPVVYTIADATGDWGYPTPFGMYPRGPGYVRMSLVFDTLLWKKDDGHSELKGALARRWSHDADKQTWVFELRADLSWHDGRPLTADDVVFTFDYLREHPWPWSDLGAVRGAAAVDAYTVEISLTRPYAPFLTNIAGTVPILPRHIWQDVGDPESFTGERAVIGSGPFKLVDYSRTHGSYAYEAWDDYYLGRPSIDEVRFVRYSREMTAAALRSGQVNAGMVPAETIQSLESAGFRVEAEPPVWAAKLMINHRKAPLSDKRFRQALAYAIDREEIVRIVRRGHATPGSIGLIPPSNALWHNPNVEPYRYDAERARALLAEFGYAAGTVTRGGSETRELELLVSAERQELGRLAEMLERQLAGAGVDVTVRAMEPKTLDAMLWDWRFDLAISGHGGLGGDPEILNKVIAEEVFTSARYHANAELNRLLEKQIGETDDQERRTMVHRIQEIYADEMPAITLYHPVTHWAHDGKVDLFFSPGGLAIGIPIPLNKLSFVRGTRE